MVSPRGCSKRDAGAGGVSAPGLNSQPTKTLGRRGEEKAAVSANFVWNQQHLRSYKGIRPI